MDHSKAARLRATVKEPQKKSDRWIQGVLVVLIFGPLIWFAWLIALPLIFFVTVGFTWHALSKNEFSAGEKLAIVGIAAAILCACILTILFAPSPFGRGSDCDVDYSRNGAYRTCY